MRAYDGTIGGWRMEDERWISRGAEERRRRRRREGEWEWEWGGDLVGMYVVVSHGPRGAVNER